MPGSSITCTGLSSIYDTHYYVAHSTGSTLLGLSIDPTNDTFNVDTSKAAAFPFLTGDVFYFGNNNLFTKYFAIRISGTSIKAATTYENAINNIAVDLTITDATPTSPASLYRYSLSNTLATFHTGPFMRHANYYVSSNWQSSTVSSIKLGVAQNFTYSFIMKQGTMTGIKSIGSNFVNSDPTTNDFAIGVLYPFVATGSPYLIGREGNSPATGYGFTRSPIPVGNVTGQFKCVNKVISFDYIASGVTTTVYSTSALTITNQLEIFCYSGTNSAGLTDCMITYT